MTNPSVKKTWMPHQDNYYPHRDSYIILKLQVIMKAALAVKDYSKVVEFFLENPIQILKQVDTKKFIKNKKVPTAKDYLQAASKLKELDKGTQSSIKKILDSYVPIEKQGKKIPSETANKIKKIEGQLRKARDFGETRKIVSNIDKDPKYQDESLNPGISMAHQIIKGGGHQPGRENIFFKESHRIAGGGIAGAMHGAAGGSIASSAKGTKQYSKVGAQAGSVGGAAIGSIQAIGEILWDWLY